MALKIHERKTLEAFSNSIWLGKENSEAER